VRLNFALKWWDSFICGHICPKTRIKKVAWDHIFYFKTLSFYRAFVRRFRALFSFFAFHVNFPFCQSRLWHRVFFLPCRPPLFLQFGHFANFAFWALLPLELTHFASLANNTTIKAGVRERCKVLTKSRNEHFVILLVMLFSQVNAQLRFNVILPDLSAKLANNTVIKVNQDINVLFCFSSCRNLSIPV